MGTQARRSGNVKVTREDWLRLAQEMLISNGVESVRILDLSRKLDVSRSSFYWYFSSRQDLLDQLLESWGGKNTRVIVERATRPSASITQAVLNVSECWLNEDFFDPRLDFAVRAWARGSAEVSRIIEKADAERLDALSGMYRRHGYRDEDASVRARVLYLTQIAYYSLEMTEPLQRRLEQVPFYVRSFTGLLPTDEEMAAFTRYVEGLAGGDPARSRSDPSAR